jgi:hypothetical protein
VSLTLTAVSGTLLNQTYLSGLNEFLQDLAQSRGSGWRTFTRTASSWMVPSLARDIDRIWNPTITDAPTASEALTERLPIVRQYTNPPKLTVLGDAAQYDRTFLSRFGGERSADPVWRTLAERNLYVPAVGGGTTVLGSPSTRAQRYWLNQQSGAQIRTTLAAQVEWLRAADKAAAQDWVGQVAERAHKDAKRQLEEYYRR